MSVFYSINCKFDRTTGENAGIKKQEAYQRFLKGVKRIEEECKTAPKWFKNDPDVADRKRQMGATPRTIISLALGYTVLLSRT